MFDHPFGCLEWELFLHLPHSPFPFPIQILISHISKSLQDCNVLTKKTREKAEGWFYVIVWDFNKVQTTCIRSYLSTLITGYTNFFNELSTCLYEVNPIGKIWHISHKLVSLHILFPMLNFYLRANYWSYWRVLTLVARVWVYYICRRKKLAQGYMFLSL